MSRLTSRPTAAPLAPDGLDHQDDVRDSQPDYLTKLRTLTEGARKLLDPDEKKLRGCLRCGIYRLPKATHVDVRQSGAGAARRTTVSGLMLCRNYWVCPWCGGSYRLHIARELEAQVAWWRAQGGSAAMLTLTVGHYRGLPLADLIACVLQAWSGFADGSPWRRLAKKLGIAHWVRAVHVTHGSAAGWHPHLHVILFLEQGVEVSETAVSRLFERWVAKVAEAATKAKLPNPRLVPRKQAQSWTEIDDATYVCRMEIDPPADDARSRSPWQLALGAAGGDADDRALWREFGAAMARVRFHSASRNLPRLERAVTRDAAASPEAQGAMPAPGDAIVDQIDADEPPVRAGHAGSVAGAAPTPTGDVTAGSPLDVLGPFLRPVTPAEPRVHLASIPALVWDAVAQVPGAVPDLLRRANAGGLTALAEGIAYHLWGRDDGLSSERAVAWVLAVITPVPQRGAAAEAYWSWAEPTAAP